MPIRLLGEVGGVRGTALEIHLAGGERIVFPQGGPVAVLREVLGAKLRGARQPRSSTATATTAPPEPNSAANPAVSQRRHEAVRAPGGQTLPCPERVAARRLCHRSMLDIEAPPLRRLEEWLSHPLHLGWR